MLLRLAYLGITNAFALLRLPDDARRAVALCGQPVRRGGPVSAGEVLLASGDLTGGHLPADTAVWLR